MLNAALSGPGPVDVENDLFRVHSPMDVADAIEMPVLLAALAPMMLRIAGEQAAGTILWMADERPSPIMWCPASPRPPRRRATCPPDRRRRARGHLRRGRRRPARAYASDVLGHADASPNYVRLLEHGDAQDVSDVMAVGSEEHIAERLHRFKEAGVTDLAARIVPLGDDAAERARSRQRTQAFLSSLTPEL